jgi:hypothetical protein
MSALWLSVGVAADFNLGQRCTATGENGNSISPIPLSYSWMSILIVLIQVSLSVFESDVSLVRYSREDLKCRVQYIMIT